MDLLAQDASPDYTIQCIKWCAENDDLEALKEHINLHGACLIADPYYTRELKELLEGSCSNGRTGIAIELLECLKSEVKLQLRDNKSWCSKLFHYVVAVGNSTIVTDLINKGADVNGIFSGKPILHTAARNGHLQIVERLVHAGSNTNSVDQRGNGIIHSVLTSQLDNKDVVVREVIKLGADPLVRASSGKLPLHLAAAHDPKVLQFFLENGQDVNIADVINKETPLHVACTTAHKEAIVKLIHFGCKFNLENSQGETPLAKLLRFTSDLNDFHSKTRVEMARKLIDIGFRMSQKNSKQAKGKLRGRDKTYDRYTNIRMSARTPQSLQEITRERVRESLNVSHKVHKHLKTLDIPHNLVPYILYHDFQL